MTEDRPEIPPALTAKEWNRLEFYDGFTPEDVSLLERLWASAQENGNPLPFAESAAADLAARIAALLPPPSPNPSR